jgi:hypothetical protein
VPNQTTETPETKKTPKRYGCLTAIAWFGLVLTLVGITTAISSSNTWVKTGELGTGVGYFMTMCAGYIGLLLALVGGFIARPKYLWMGCIIVGIAYISSFYGYWVKHELVGFLFLSIPGLVFIAGGLIFLGIHKRGMGRQIKMAEKK